MHGFAFAANLNALLRNARELVIVARARMFAPGAFPKGLLAESLTDLAVALGHDTPPGLRGGARSTLVWPSPSESGLRWLHVVVLPERVSRYNAPSRADCIRHAFGPVQLGQDHDVAVMLLLDDPEHLLGAVSAVSRARPGFGLKSNPRRGRLQVAAFDPQGEPIPIPPAVEAITLAARQCAEWVDTPPTELDPERFAAIARARLSALPEVEVEEIVGEELRAVGLGGIHAVGRTATAAPRFIVARRPGTGRGVALVGKGITFDTGGLQLKPKHGITGMKSDMAGAAATLGAFLALAQQPPRRPLSLVLCLAENAIGPTAYRPDDVLRLHSGKTVEINNTDAEGRLLLADGLSYAARNLEAEVLLDAASLTGAQSISTGQVHAAVVSNDAELEALAVEAGRHSGDLVHPLPFAPELFQHEFRSQIADMRNSVANRMNAQSACAAQFLWAHLDGLRGRRWCHVDLAGPSFLKERGTGFGVALLAEMVTRL